MDYSSFSIQNTKGVSLYIFHHKPRLPGPRHTWLNVDEQGVDVAILK